MVDKQELQRLRELAASMGLNIVPSKDLDPKSPLFEKFALVGGRTRRIGPRGHAAASAVFKRGDGLDLEGIARELGRTS